MEKKATLLGLTPDDQANMKYEDLLTLRRAAYAEHVQGMDIPVELKEWAAIMQARFGSAFKIWHNTYTSWIVGLMVVRYSEAIDHWPEAFTKEDVKRAQAWAKGQLPAGLEYIKPGGMMSGLLGWAAILVGIGLSLLQSPDWILVSLLPVFGSAMTDFLENKLVDNFFRTTTYTRPSVLGVALFTAAPGETGGGTEVSGGSYARVDNPPLNTNWNATQGGTSGNSSGTGGLTDNAVDITFPSPSANWGTITHFAIFDATSGGNMLIYGALGTSKTVNNGDPAPKFTAGDLDITWA